MKTLKDAIELIMAEPPEPHYPAYYADLLREADVPDKDVGKCSETPNGSETIYRQEAIDAAISADMENHSGILSEKRARVIELHINTVPPAHPEKRTDKRTKMHACDLIEALPSAQPEPCWIPIKWHNCTNEDREKYGFSDDVVAVFDNEMPDDNQEILITTSHGYVEKDICYIDEFFSLDSGYDWINDVKAWKPLPKPYKPEGSKT